VTCSGTHPLSLCAINPYPILRLRGIRLIVKKAQVLAARRLSSLFFVDAVRQRIEIVGNIQQPIAMRSPFGERPYALGNPAVLLCTRYGIIGRHTDRNKLPRSAVPATAWKEIGRMVIGAGGRRCR
jgi:hypothetical protein